MTALTLDAAREIVAAARAEGREMGLKPLTVAVLDAAGNIKALEREVRERRQVNEILRKASAYFGQADFGRPFKRRSRSSTITAPSMGSSRSASGADYPIDLPRP